MSAVSDEDYMNKIEAGRKVTTPRPTNLTLPDECTHYFLHKNCSMAWYDHIELSVFCKRHSCKIKVSGERSEVAVEQYSRA